MERRMLGLFLGIILISFGLVFAQGNGSSGNAAGCFEDAKVCNDGSTVVRTGSDCNFAKCPNELNDETNETNGAGDVLADAYNDLGEMIRNRIQAGVYVGEDGRRIQVRELAQNRLQFQVNNVSADCDCNISQEQVQNRTQLKVKLNNGRTAEIKIMPDVASETALNRLGLNVCSEENNCSIELKEVGRGSQTKLAYELKTQRQSKVFGLFRAQMQVQSQIDAENGKIIQTKKPWWAFLASEPEEFSEEEISCAGAGEYFMNPANSPNPMRRECCEGLTQISGCLNYNPENEFADENGCVLATGCGGICSDCGNGVCEDWENPCNCASDCAK